MGKHSHSAGQCSSRGVQVPPKLVQAIWAIAAVILPSL
jgi:hypothetical protein